MATLCRESDPATSRNRRGGAQWLCHRGSNRPLRDVRAGVARCHRWPERGFVGGAGIDVTASDRPYGKAASLFQI